MGILQSLKEYYHDAGISATNFRCEHLEDCKRDYTSFTEAREAYVGTKYEEGKVPRLLFLSLDSGAGETKPEDRTMEACRHWEENCCEVDKLPKNLHWYRTHELAYILMKRFDSNVELTKIQPYFAHTNSAKCCMNKEGRKMANWQMFKNCQRYIAGELSCLEPDILVTQGDMAKEAVEVAFQSEVKGDQKHCGYSVTTIKNKPVFWIHTYHPRHFGGFNHQRRECYDNWSNLVVEFINNNR
jgi:hypothetical protein